jgi:hypothetical protein
VARLQRSEAFSRRVPILPQDLHNARHRPSAITPAQIKNALARPSQLKCADPLRPTMRHFANLLRASLTGSLMLVAMVEAAVAGPGPPLRFTFPG